MREQLLRGDSACCVGMTVVLHQGLWAWMMLVAAETDAAPPAPVRPASGPPTLPAKVCNELLAAWTDLVVGTVRRLEVS